MSEHNWKRPIYLLGGALGLIGGLLSAYLYTRTAEENSGNKPPAKIATGDAFKLGMSAMTLLRPISDLGIRKPGSR